MMDVRALSIEGAFEITPRQFSDERGVFLESFRGDRLAKAIGHRPDIIQTNVSVSSRGTVRGVHFADVPPSQAKYVTALSGSFIDTVDRRAIYLAEGLGHVICCLEDDSTVMYLCSATHAPTREHAINPLDPELGLVLPEGLTPVLSAKDAAAPCLSEAAQRPGCPRRRGDGIHGCPFEELGGIRTAGPGLPKTLAPLGARVGSRAC